MPAISLIVCVYRQRDLLARLLDESRGCYDDLVVVHDGPDTDGIRSLVEQNHGRFFERERAFQQEPHWPFAWAQAQHDWILRLDADEFPSVEMKAWLQDFRNTSEPSASISGFTCIWPLWDGQKTLTRQWPAGRHFLFHRQRVRFFGMVEQVPVADGMFQPLELVLHHQPNRRALGLKNVLFRRQAYLWRTVIARSLLAKPTDLACWRWTNEAWPESWEIIRRRPLRTAASRLIMGPLRSARDEWKHERKVTFSAVLNGAIHHSLICLEYWRLRRNSRKVATPS
ncbi:MAG TPA: glycosyltransferase [Verrucomicrobiae bacterium]